MAAVHDLASYRESHAAAPSMNVAIIGAGVAGICMAIKLKEAGIDFTIYEKAGDIGGTWRDNNYPGCSCDVALHMYQYSFELSPEWQNKYADHAQIKAYLDHVVEKYGLWPYIKLNCGVSELNFDERAGIWHVKTETGETAEANVVVAGTGQLNRPAMPNIPGVETFKGDAWHSARWNHDVDITGKRMAVIGNGASAIQFVPEIARKAGEVVIFQRSASWVLPRPERKFMDWERALYRRFPFLMKLHRLRLWLMGEQLLLSFRHMGKLLEKAHDEEAAAHVADPELRAKLRPDYAPGCKRVLFSNDWWPAMGRPNVNVETTPIDRITEAGVRTTDGTEHEFDIIVYGTGFDTTHFLGPIEVHGLGGKSLREEWADGAEAHRGIAVSGFPNFYLLYGPNTNLGHNSIIFMIECQVAYVRQIIERMRDEQLAYVDVKREAQHAWNDAVQQDNANSVFAAGCTSWYKTADGRITNNWPNHTYYYWWQTRHPRWEEFVAVSKQDAARAQAAE